ncbi:S41 family peptidase [Pedobacter sp. ASV28]|uniref:S41 family peptidase n=1 Tax=Pedobacter sp. ASV28 TaxID=2795123 RepID=UPI0018EB3F0C|nr:S41 family peptidase [Pedobacter sp. ASV28]
MKKIAYTLLLCFACLVTLAQNINETDKLFLFIKTWNFLKYNHQKFTSGKMDADSFFLVKQELLQDIKTREEINNMLIQSVQSLGALSPNLELHQASLNNIIKINGLHQWYVESKEINVSLKELLLRVYNSRNIKSNYYAPVLNYHTEIPNEKKYAFEATVNLPESMRLLALAKLQGVIDYLYPHHKLMKENWDVVIKRNIPLFKNCRSRMEYEILILKIVANLNDSHAYNRFYTNLKFKNQIFKNTFYPPFDYKIMDKRMLVTGIIVPEICGEAGINIGDWITEINGQTVAARIDILSGLLSASNRSTLVSNLNNYNTNFIWSLDRPEASLKLIGSKGTKATTVKFIRLNDRPALEKINVFFQNRAKASNKLKGFMLLDHHIAYFNIDKIIQLMENIAEDKIDNHVDSILNLAAQQKAIIFDMRGYPQWSGFMYSYLYKKFGSIDNRFAKYVKADLNNIGTFNWINSPEVYNNVDIVPEHFVYKGKVAIIVNARTRSLSEWNTMNLQSMFPQAVTIGEQTSGGDGDEKYLNIPGNYIIHFTGNAIYYNDGTSAQGVGVKIDKKIKFTKADMLEGKDVFLGYAIDRVGKP